eukprot:Phypoly_transcript_11419.p1 GENE.Phypoly_transcript_11419~~Phypoly_transcript_11419.p1  ORF type:complete len:344 (+),score=42.54 Phypoly_transcript_11419:39-1070(+)
MSGYAQTVFQDIEKLDETVIPFEKYVQEADIILLQKFEYTTPVEYLLQSLRDMVMALLVAYGTGDDPDFLHKKHLSFSFQPTFLTLRPLFFDEGDLAIARLFAALHLLNGKNVELHEIEALLHLTFVESTEIGNLPMAELEVLSVKLLSHPRATKVFKEIIDTSFNYDSPPAIAPSELVSKVVFFELTNDPELWGFSGISTIYVNVASLLKGLQQFAIVGTSTIELRNDLGLKLMVSAIGLHEGANMAVRKAHNDLKYNQINRKFHHLGNSPGAIAQVRFFDLPLLRWGEYFAADTTILEILLQYSSENTEEPPHIPIQGLNSFHIPKLQPHLYKQPTAMKWR